MACPTCGGGLREPIAPGLWRCTSPVSQWQGTGATPGLGPPAVNVTGTCGSQYHEGPTATAELCHVCDSTYAIGVCAACRRPVCGDHSSLLDGQRLCPADVDQRRQEGLDRQHRDRQPSLDQRADAITAWKLEVADSLAANSSTVAVCRIARASRDPRWLTSVRDTTDLFEEWGVTVPPDHEIATWLAGAARKPARSMIGRRKRNLLGRTRDVSEVEGWVFPKGSSRVHQPRDAAPFFLTSAIDTDGNRWLGLSEYHGWEMRQNPLEPLHGDFATEALAEMADIAELPDLPITS